MGGSTHLLRAGGLALALGLAAFWPAPEAKAITYGQQDCTTPEGEPAPCQYPNTVSLTGFRLPRAGEEDVGLISYLRCSGSLLSADATRFVILTAGHCASGWLLDPEVVDVGVSFDPVITKDLPEISSTVWSPAQYILGGLPVLNTSYGRQGAQASNIQFDYAIVVFEPEEGVPGDILAIEPITLPEQDYLLNEVEVSATDPLQITAVGYGTGEAHNYPGEGGNQGGAVNSTEEFGQRWFTHLTAAFSFMGPEGNLLLGSQNPARGNEGTCGGDSGGPLFYVDDGTEIQIGITSSGDAICRATSIIARTDSARAVEFLTCVQTGADFSEIALCGCPEVTNQGECPAQQ